MVKIAGKNYRIYYFYHFLRWRTTLENGGSGELQAINNITATSAFKKVQELQIKDSHMPSETEMNHNVELYNVLHGKLPATTAARRFSEEERRS